MEDDLAPHRRLFAAMLLIAIKDACGKLTDYESRTRRPGPLAWAALDWLWRDEDAINSAEAVSSYIGVDISWLRGRVLQDPGGRSRAEWLGFVPRKN